MSNFWDADPVATPTKGANFWEFDPVAEGPSVAADVAKSAGTGIVKGALGLAGMVPDISAAAHSAANKYLFDPLLDATIGKPSNSEVERAFDPNKALGSESLQRGLESVTGPLHKPQTTAGEFAQTAGEFAPGLLGGGEGLMARLAKQVAAPAIASETAGQATKGTAAEPYARVAGAVAGGGLASALSKAKAAAAPTVEELKDAARAQYQHPDVKAVQINPDAVTALRNTIKTDLESGANSGFRAANEKKTFSAIDELANPAQSSARVAGNPVTIDDLDSVRKVLGRVSKEKDAMGAATSDAAAASRAMGHIDDFLTNLKQPHLVAGDASKAVPILQEARGNWGAAKRAEEIQTKLENARIQAASTYGGGNINNASRQALRPMLKNNAAKAVGYSDAEKEALSQAVEGTKVGNLARLVGKLAPSGGVKGLAHVALASGTGGASIPLTLASEGMKLIGDASTKRSIRKLEQILRERSPLAQQQASAAASTPGYLTSNPVQGALPSGLVAALLAAQGSRLQSP
jgi:hypothetical protein